jgi:hypothetical protein
MDTPGDARKLGRYLLELAPRQAGYEDIRSLADRTRQACAALSRDGVTVRLLRSVFVPEDGTCLLVFDASSAPAVADAGRLAGLPQTRLSVLLDLPEDLAPVL